MSLESGVNLERTSSGVHASSVLGVLNVLETELASIIPMLIVFVLSHERNGSLGVVGIEFRHV